MANVKCILAEQSGQGGGNAGGGIILQKIEITQQPSKTTYFAGDSFNPQGMEVMASYGIGQNATLATADVTAGCKFTPNPLTDGTTEVTVSYSEMGATCTAKVSVTVKHRVTSLTVTTMPSQTEYEYGDTLVTTGVVITANYSDKQTAEVTGSCQFAPQNLNTVGQQEITVTYTEESGTVSTTFNVTVLRKKIPIPTWKGPLTYNGQQQSADNKTLWNNYTDNMTIGGQITGTDVASYSAEFTPTANYRWSDGEEGTKSVAWNIEVLAIAAPTANQTNFTYNQSAQGPTFTYNSTYVTASGDTTPKINASTYTATFALIDPVNTKWNDSSTADKTISWTIAVRSITIPTANTTSFTYNGNTQGPTFTYDATYVTAGGDSTGKITAGNYTASFTLKDTVNTKWTDNSITAKTIGWKIDKANGSVTLTPNTVALNANNYTGVNVNIAKASDGAISYSAAPSGITLSLSGTTLTVKGDNRTAVSSTSITITVAEGTNHKQATATLTVSAAYWSFDGGGTTPDNTWWNNLSDGIQGMSDAELDALVGKELTITLTSAVLGTTTHKVICIGHDLDKDKSNTSRKTLTFQTKNCLAQTTVFGSSNGYWTGSTVRQRCIDYYNALPFKSAVKTVSKGCATTTDSNQSIMSTDASKFKYTDETVFLPSDCEMGFPKGHNYSSGLGYAASYDEFCEHNTAKKAYPYYKDNNSRIKYLGDSSTSAQYWWERSLSYGDTNYACRVSTDGKPNNYYYSNSIGFAPAFVI